LDLRIKIILFPILKMCRGKVPFEIPVLHCGVIEVLALLECYMAWVGSWLPTFQDSLSFPSSGVKQSKENGTNRLSCNIGNNPQPVKCNIPEE
jgi:hypothetical protein